MDRRREGLGERKEEGRGREVEERGKTEEGR